MKTLKLEMLAVPLFHQLSLSLTLSSYYHPLVYVCVFCPSRVPPFLSLRAASHSVSRRFCSPSFFPHALFTPPRTHPVCPLPEWRQPDEFFRSLTWIPFMLFFCSSLSIKLDEKFSALIRQGDGFVRFRMIRVTAR